MNYERASDDGLLLVDGNLFKYKFALVIFLCALDAVRNKQFRVKDKNKQ